MTIPQREQEIEDSYHRVYEDKWKKFSIEKSVRLRKCNCCGNIISPGEKCLRFTYLGSSKITANLCINCMARMLRSDV